MMSNIIIENGPLESTGGKVWPASKHFYEFICVEFPKPSVVPANVLELGSGCGWLGMSLALEFPLWSITMCEQTKFGAKAWLDHNVALNPSISVQTFDLDWNAANFSCVWNIVFGCELVYSYEGARLLPRVIANCLTSASVCYYAHTLNRFPTVDEVFIKELDKLLDFEVVFGGSDFANRSQYDQLFPELALVVFRIVLKERGAP